MSPGAVRKSVMNFQKSLSAFGLCLMSAMIVASAAHGDDEAMSGPASELTARCLLLVRAESSFPPNSSQHALAAHQLRMRTICWDWHALTNSAAPERQTKAQALLARCVGEAPFDLARAHELYYARHVKSVEQMCHEFAALIGGGSQQ